MNEHSIVLKLDANGVAAGIDETTKSLNDLGLAEDKVTASSARLTKEQKQEYDLYRINATAAAQQARELHNLRASLDPAYASTQKLAHSQATLSTALKNGSISIVEYNALMAKAGQSTSIMDKYSHQFKRTLLDLTPIISGLGLLTLAHGAIQATDHYVKLTSQLKIATNSTSEYAFAMSEVKRISSAAQVDINAIGSLYQRLSLALKTSGRSQKDVALITETVSLGLKANGASARESASAMLQLSQSFGSGRMAGEEFNSMAEAAPNVLRALAASMRVPYGMLKGLAAEGKITSEVMAKAFTDPALLESFRAQAASMRTITGSWVELTNALMLYVGENAKASGGVGVISGALSFLADNVKLVANALMFAAGVMAMNFVAAFIKSKLAIAANTRALSLNAIAAAALARENMVLATTDALLTGNAQAATAARMEYLAATRAATTAQGALTASTITWGSTTTAAITSIGVALRTAAMAHPIIAATTAITAIVIAIANWESVTSGAKATFTWFKNDFLGGMEFLAASVGIGIGELVQKFSLIANLTWPQLKSGEAEKQFIKFGDMAEQARIDAAARISGIYNQAISHEAIIAAERFAADTEDWEKLTNNKEQQRKAEIEALNEQWNKITEGHQLSHAEVLDRVARYNYTLAKINDKFNKEKSPKMSDSQSALNAEARRLEDYIQQTQAKASGKTLTQSEIYEQNLLQKVRKDANAEYVAGLKVAANIIQEDLLFAEASNKSTEQLNSARQKTKEIIDSINLSATAYTEKLDLEKSLVGKTAGEVALLTKQFEIHHAMKKELLDLDKDPAYKVKPESLTGNLGVDNAAVKRLRDEQDAARKAIEDAANKELSAAAISIPIEFEMKDTQKTFDKLSKDFEGLFDHVFDKGVSVFQSIADSFSAAMKKVFIDLVREQMIKPFADKLLATTMNIGKSLGFGNGAPAGQSGFAGIEKFAGGLSGIFGNAGTASSAPSGLLGGMMGAGNFMGPVQPSTMMNIGSSMAGIGSFITAAMPYVGIAMMAAPLFTSKISAEALALVTAADVQRKQGSGSVLGDENAKSNSISKAITSIEKNTLEMSEYSFTMTNHLKSINDSMKAFVTILAKSVGGDIARSMGIARSSTESSGLSKEFQNLNFLGKQINDFIFGKVTSTVTDTGLIFEKEVREIGNKINRKTLKSIDVLISKNAALTMGELANSTGLVKTYTAGTTHDSGFLGTGIGGGDSTWSQSQIAKKEVQTAIGLIYTNIRETFRTIGATVGKDISGLNKLFDSFSSTVGKLSFEGMNAEEKIAALDAAISKDADTFASTMAKKGGIFDGWNKFQQAGEGMFTTLIRISQEIDNVTTAFKMLGKQGQASAEIADALVTSLGGMEKFNTKFDFFAKNFLTETQRLAPVQQAMNAEFAKLHIAVPKTKEAYVKLVSGADLTTESGRNLFETLIDLAPSFDKLATAAAKLQEQLKGDMFGNVIDFNRAKSRVSQGNYFIPNLPSFAVGTNSLPADMVIQAHQGERIVPAADNVELMTRLNSPSNDSNAAEERQALRSEITQLRSENLSSKVAIITLLAKMEKILDKWDHLGIPEVQEAA